MTTETAGIREIDTGALPDRYARGWHCLGPVAGIPGRQAPRRRDIRRHAGGLRRLQGRPASPRRLLPAHGRQPVPGHHQGRRGGLPVPRLALGRRRQVQAGALRQAHAAVGPHPLLDHRRARRTAVRLARPRGQSAAAGGADPRDCRSPPATSGRTGSGTGCSSRAPTAARSSTTSPTWRTSSTSTSVCRRTSRTSSRATSPRSTCTTSAGPT